MKQKETIEYIRYLSEKYNDPAYFKEDPIIFPKHFAQLLRLGSSDFDFPVPNNYKVRLQDIEIAAVIAAHLAWGRREIIVRDIKRAMDEMGWKPYSYILNGDYKRMFDTQKSLHRTIKWCEFAQICDNLNRFYAKHSSIEELTVDQIRVEIYAQKSNPKGANKKIEMLRRWMVRDDGIVDLGIWKKIKPCDLIIPLDVHVHKSALNLGITKRSSADFTTAKEITHFLKLCFPNDPAKGDFALFAHSIESSRNDKMKMKEKERNGRRERRREERIKVEDIQNNK